MDNIILAVGTLIILWLIYDISRTASKNKKVQDKIDDFNIEFGSSQGEGIELVKKQYPDLHLKDDHRTGIEEDTDAK